MRKNYEIPIKKQNLKLPIPNSCSFETANRLQPLQWYESDFMPD